MNARAINAEAVGGFDEVGEPIIHWDKVDDTKPAVGYAFAWKLKSGFVKVEYWTKERCIAHAQKFSKAYQKKKNDSPWVQHFDLMCLKTVAKNALSRWGILSVELQKAIEHDSGVQRDIDAEVSFLDAETGAATTGPATALSFGQPATEIKNVTETGRDAAAAETKEPEKPMTDPAGPTRMVKPLGKVLADAVKFASTTALQSVLGVTPVVELADLPEPEQERIAGLISAAMEKESVAKETGVEKPAGKEKQGTLV